MHFVQLDNKGIFNGICNRSACQTPGATYYNFSTRRYYCSECAKLINEANRSQAMKLYGHDLCLTKDQIEERNNG